MKWKMECEELSPEGKRHALCVAFGELATSSFRGEKLKPTIASLFFLIVLLIFSFSKRSEGIERIEKKKTTMKKTIHDARLYGILDLGYVRPSDVERVAEALCEGGAGILQLRAKSLDEFEVEALGQRIEPITRNAGVPLIINDFPELVPTIGAQGAHLGQDDRTIADARWRAGRALGDEVPPVLVGKSTHSVEQAIAAQAEGADYIGFGPLFATPTKPGRPAIGLEDVRRVHELVSIPIFCIGGIKLENLDTVLAAGARRVVIVSGLLQAPDVVAACREACARLAG
jgi:thiamine-phosphate pyrophosphorylase